MVSAHNSTQYIVKVSGNIWTICVRSGWASGWSCLSRRSSSSLLLSTADTHGFSRVLLIFIKSLINSVTIQSIQRTGLPPWCKIKSLCLGCTLVCYEVNSGHCTLTYIFGVTSLQAAIVSAMTTVSVNDLQEKGRVCAASVKPPASVLQKFTVHKHVVSTNKNVIIKSKRMDFLSWIKASVWW